METTEKKAKYKGKSIHEPYGLAYWFENAPMCVEWYKTKEKRDSVINELKNGEPLKIEWDYEIVPDSIIIPKRFFAFNVVSDNYEIELK